MFPTAPIARFAFKVAAASDLSIVNPLPEGQETAWIDGRYTGTFHCWSERPLGAACLLVYQPLVELAALAPASDMSEVGVAVVCGCAYTR